MLRFLSLFAGIGGFDRGLEAAGWACAGQVESDPFCTRVLTARWPDMPRWGDVRTVGVSEPMARGRWAGLRPRADDEPGTGARTGRADARVDLLCGGFPCQDFSVAGKRAGLVGYRGTLFWEIVRLAKELRPPWGLFENVPGLLSSHRGRDFWAVLQGLRECWPVVGWRVLDSQYFGVPQRRRRVFLVGGPTEAAVRAVLVEPEGGGGHPPAGGEAGAGVAACLDGSPYADREAEHSRLVVGAPQQHAVMTSTVRRLTPLECERLQAFPDGWTCLCRPLVAWATDPETASEACQCPDSPRYRAMGNAVTVSVVEWLARRLARPGRRAVEGA